MSLPDFTQQLRINVTQHVNADPGLKQNMLDNGLIVWFMGKWFLSRKGELEMAQRAEARARADVMGCIQTEPKPAGEELPSGLEHDND